MSIDDVFYYALLSLYAAQAVCAAVLAYCLWHLIR